MAYHLHHRRPLGGPLEDTVSAVVGRQVDTILDTAGDRFSTYLDSPGGQAVLNKFEGKVETAIVNVAEKRKWDLALIGLSLTALAAVGVSTGSRLTPRGTQLAALVAVGAVLPLFLRKEPAPVTPPARRPKRA